MSPVGLKTVGTAQPSSCVFALGLSAVSVLLSPKVSDPVLKFDFQDLRYSCEISVPDKTLVYPE